MRRTLGAVAFGLFILLVVGSSGLAQVKVESQGGAGAFGHAGSDGASARAGPSPSRAYVDPVLVEAFDVQLSQIAILVLDPSLEQQVVARLQELGLDHHLYANLHMLGIVLPRDRLDDVSGVPGVLTIYRNERMQEDLDNAARYIGAPVVWNTFHDKGAGATVLIVDSGVDGSHPDVMYKVNLIENVVPAREASGLVGGPREGVPATDADGHGTHVASIVAGLARGTTDPGRYKGIAYEAKLVGFQAGIQDPQTGEVSFESVTVLEAFDYAIGKQKLYNISVVSNSWGANGDFDDKSPINVATLQLYKKGLVVTFAAGNEGQDGRHTLNKYAVPPWVLSVAAGDYFNNIAKFSSRGTDPAESGIAFDHPDVTAPGVGITAAKASTNVAGLNPLQRTSSDPLYTTKSGTSMATPVVSGAAALLLSANPNLSPDDVMDILTATATPLTVPVWEGGAGYVNVLNAYKLALKAPGHRAEFLSGKVKYAGPESGDPEMQRDAVTVGYGEGAARQLGSTDLSVTQFANQLVSTGQGLVFLAGTAVLVLLAFSFRRR